MVVIVDILVFTACVPNQGTLVRTYTVLIRSQLFLVRKRVGDERAEEVQYLSRVSRPREKFLVHNEFSATVQPARVTELFDGGMESAFDSFLA